ncbi:putative ribonuclease H-like domain-containing protein [Tanacetum coccineum]
MDDICREKGIKREYNVARTPQQNGVAERRNMTLIDAARTMLADSKLPTTFWAEAVSTACYVQNRVLVAKPHNKTPYELFRGKFDGKSDEGFFVGYSLSSKAFRVYNIRTMRVEENLHMVAAGTISNESTCTQGEFNVGTSTQKEEISQNCKDVGNGELKSTADDQKQDKDGPHNESDEKDKSEDDSSPKEVNAAGQHVNSASPEVNTGSFKLNIVDLSVNTASSYELDSLKTYSNQKHAKAYLISLGGCNARRTMAFYAPIVFKGTLWVHQALEHEKPLVKDGDADDVDVHLYRSMIGSLMYLTTSRPDIMFAVCACAKFQVTPKTSHLLAIKRIFRYLKGKPTLSLWYSRDSPFELVAYTDSDYAGATQDRKSTTGGCQFLGNRLISWQCKKQTVVATSTTEAEYVAAASCCGQVLWIQNQLLDYGYNFMNTMIHIDNNSTICIIENPVQHSKTKHIEIRHHFIRDCNAKKLIQMVKIDTEHNVADLLTKGFDAGRISTELGDKMERAATTASSLQAEQDSGNINRTQSMATLNEPNP